MHSPPARSIADSSPPLVCLIASIYISIPLLFPRICLASVALSLGGERGRERVYLTARACVYSFVKLVLVLSCLGAWGELRKRSAWLRLACSRGKRLWQSQKLEAEEGSADGCARESFLRERESGWVRRGGRGLPLLPFCGFVELEDKVENGWCHFSWREF